MNSPISNSQNIHFILIPLMAQGHMIPMIDMSKLIANHGITITIITTPVNAFRCKSIVDRAVKASSLNIRLCEIEFPVTEAIPKGCENLDMLPSLSLCVAFQRATDNLKEPIEKLLKEMQPKPSCIISDIGFYWTSELANKLSIPRIVFDGNGCFSSLCLHNLGWNLETKNTLLGTITSENKPFAIPGLPDRILTTKAKLPKSITTFCEEYILRQKMIHAANESFGILVNSFKELEPEYFERFKKAKGKSVWCVGPVSLFSQDDLDKADRGKPTAIITRDQCLNWLDLQKPNSVIYACLGSVCSLEASQMMELALGLEASKQPFILTLREGSSLKDTEKLIDEDGFVERVNGQGLIIRGWAPQVLILSHSSVGGFLTHCGWNSTLEGLSAGLPMVTCPIFWEQFLNEEYLVHVLKVGIKIRNPKNKQDEEEEAEVSKVKRYDVKRAVELVMDGQGKGKEMRDRAQKFKVLAHKAMEEQGSSHNDMLSMIQHVIQETEKSKNQES